MSADPKFEFVILFVMSSPDPLLSEIVTVAAIFSPPFYETNVVTSRFILKIPYGIDFTSPSFIICRS